LTDDGAVVRQALQLYGITNAQQARREATYHLRAQRMIRRRVKFEMAMDGLAAEGGDIVRVASVLPAWTDWAGRASGTPKRFQISNELELSAGETYQALIRLPDDQGGFTATITSPAGRYLAGAVIETNASVETRFDEAPVAIATTSQSARDFRLTRTRLTRDLTIAVEGVEYVPEVYADPGWTGGIGDMPTSGCVEPGWYYIDFATHYAAVCPPPANCGDLENDYCFSGDITVTCTGAACECVTIYTPDQNGVVIRIAPGCEGEQLCLNVEIDGQWDACPFACDDPDPSPLLCALVSVCTDDDTVCWTICP